MAMITGSAGRDTLEAPAGDNILTCGQGSDTFSVRTGTAEITDLGNGGDTLNVGLYGRAKAFLAGS